MASSEAVLQMRKQGVLLRQNSLVLLVVAPVPEPFFADCDLRLRTVLALLLSHLSG